MTYRSAWTACEMHRAGSGRPLPGCQYCMTETINKLMDILDTVQASNDKILLMLAGDPTVMEGLR